MIATAKGGIHNVFVFVFSNVISGKEPHTTYFQCRQKGQRNTSYIGKKYKLKLCSRQVSGDVGTCTFFPGE